MKEVASKTSFLNFFRLLFRNKCGEALLLPFTKGKQWNDFAARIPANHYQYPKGSFRDVTRNGFRFHLDISDYMQWLIYFGVSIEPREKLYALVKPGMTVLDVGANIGETSLIFSKLVGADGRIHAFEPDPETFKRLQEHVTLNGVKNITLHNAGLGNEAGTFYLERNEQHSGGNRISTAGTKIDVKRGDDIVTANAIQPSLLKIDVEGFEEYVLNGLEATIIRFKPIIFIETIDVYLKRQNSSAHAVINRLNEFGYELVNAFTDKAISPEADHTNLHCDIIARPK